MANSTKGIRTIALVGQAGSGKTTLAEALLAKAGAIHTAGQGSYSLELSHYEPAPAQLQQKLHAAPKPQTEAE